VQQRRGEREDVLAPVPKRRQQELDGREAREQVGTETAGLHLLSRVLHRASHHDDVEAMRGEVCPAPLEQVEQALLRPCRKAGHVLDVDRATVGRREQTRLAAPVAGKPPPNRLASSTTGSATSHSTTTNGRA